jgi:hypothetical protein
VTILENLKTTWNRWWRVESAPEPPPFDVTAIPVDVVNSMMETIVKAKVASEATRSGMRPPSSNGPDKPLLWPTWEGCMRDVNCGPDWSPCRFAVMMTIDGVEQAVFVFGAVRGQFGIHSVPMRVCSPMQDEERLLCPLTFLPSGYGLALFKDRETAVEASNIVAGMLDRETAPPISNREWWSATVQALKQRWAFHGIAPDEGMHVHFDNEFVAPILVKSEANLNAGKPEKLA